MNTMEDNEDTEQDTLPEEILNIYDGTPAPTLKYWEYELQKKQAQKILARVNIFNRQNVYEKIIVCICNLERNQNLLQTIKIIEYCHTETKNFKLYIVGEGSAKAELEELVFGLGLEQVIFFVPPPKNIFVYLLGCDIMLVPYPSQAWEEHLFRAIYSGIKIVSDNRNYTLVRTYWKNKIQIKDLKTKKKISNTLFLPIHNFNVFAEHFLRLLKTPVFARISELDFLEKYNIEYLNPIMHSHRS